MTEPTSIPESLPSPDGLPRRVKPVARTRKPTAADLAAEAAMQAAADALVAEIEAEGGDPHVAEVSGAAAPAEPEAEPRLSQPPTTVAETREAADEIAESRIAKPGGSPRTLML